MDVTQAELELINDLDGCFRWAGIKPGLEQGLQEAMGWCGNLREVMHIPQGVWDALVQRMESHTTPAVEEILEVVEVAEIRAAPAVPGVPPEVLGVDGSEGGGVGCRPTPQC